MNSSYIARAMEPLVEELSKEYPMIVCMAGDVGAVSADTLVLPVWVLQNVGIYCSEERKVSSAMQSGKDRNV